MVPRLKREDARRRAIESGVDQEHHRLRHYGQCRFPLHLTALDLLFGGMYGRGGQIFTFFREVPEGDVMGGAWVLKCADGSSVEFLDDL